MSKLGDEPAYPTTYRKIDGGLDGLTKRERACIDLRIPESGNAELDVLIAKAQRRDAAVAAMQGLMDAWIRDEVDELTMPSVARTCDMADMLLAELAKEPT